VGDDRGRFGRVGYAGGRLSRVRTAVDRLREREFEAVLLAATAGFLLAVLHWVGFALAGGLLGLAAGSLKRAVAYGLAFGVLVWLLFAGSLLAGGYFSAYVGMGRLALLSVAVPLGLSTIGAIAVRGWY